MDHSNHTNSHTASPSPGASEPNVRHIPIYVEGRSEPIINKPSSSHKSTTNSMPAAASAQAHQPDLPPQQQSGSAGSIFNRVKNLPVRAGFDSDFFTQTGRTVPLRMENQRASHSPSPQPNRTPASASSSERIYQPPPQFQSPTQSSTPDREGGCTDNAVTKIQKIQREVSELMDGVEKFTGTSKRDKQYLYLDEMLTQNLLKLDTIDTEGKEDIKQARREAIKCINACIAVLEAKTDAATANK